MELLDVLRVTSIAFNLLLSVLLLMNVRENRKLRRRGVARVLPNEDPNVAANGSYLFVRVERGDHEEVWALTPNDHGVVTERATKNPEDVERFNHL